MPLSIRTSALLGTPSKKLHSGTPEFVRGLTQFLSYCHSGSILFFLEAAKPIETTTTIQWADTSLQFLPKLEAPLVTSVALSRLSSTRASKLYFWVSPFFYYRERLANRTCLLRQKLDHGSDMVLSTTRSRYIYCQHWHHQHSTGTWLHSSLFFFSNWLHDHCYWTFKLHLRASPKIVAPTSLLPWRFPIIESHHSSTP
jgi:hypothetical protein